jgi:hypothetical protein
MPPANELMCDDPNMLGACCAPIPLTHDVVAQVEIESKI